MQRTALWQAAENSFSENSSELFSALAEVYKICAGFEISRFCGVVSAERFACRAVYDLTSWLDESLKAEVRKDALLQSTHAGETGGGGILALALTARVDDQRFPDAA